MCLYVILGEEGLSNFLIHLEVFFIVIKGFCSGFLASLPLGNYIFKFNQSSSASGVKVTQMLRRQRFIVRILPGSLLFCKIEFLCFFGLSSVYF